MSPRRLFRLVATAEVITWALLLFGMFLKYVTRTTALGVTVFGMVHGIVFLTYCVVTVIVSTNQRWSVREDVLALAAGVPPFLTLWFEKRQERRGRLEGPWRLGGPNREQPVDAAERAVAVLLARPRVAIAVVACVVAALTALALFVGPPGGSH